MIFALLLACSPSAPEASPEADRWQAQGEGGFKPPPALHLEAAPLLVGRATEWTVSGDLAWGEEVHLLVSYLGLAAPGEERCPALLGGACMALPQTVLLATATVGEEGQATLRVEVPPSVPVGRTVALQAAVIRGLGGRNSLVSNAVEAETTPVIFGCMDPEATNYLAEATVDDGGCTYPWVEIETFGWDGNSGHLIHGYGTGTPEQIALHFCQLNGFDRAIDWTTGVSEPVDTCYCVYSPPGIHPLDVVSPCCSGIASRNCFLGPITCE